MNLYAATKRANELMAYSYSNLYGITITGIRFFSVYGPWGRPDMAYFTFTKAILENQPIKIYNEGRMKRDFTYIDDITDGIIKVCKRHPSECTKNSVPFKIYNLGKSKPVDINSFIQLLEDAIGKKAIKEYLPMHPGEVEETFADITEATNDIGFNPKVELGQGIEKFISWYMSYFNHIP
jgi:UDP-glucuronate 4-epimerase